jgi:eukaryotic-like serine/threonine-protein kinase
MKLAHDIQPQLDKYELISVLGHGGMATVYRARDRRLGRDVAIKIIHRHLRDDPEIATRFVREARVVAKLHHPNIVEVFDVSEPDESERYLVVELVEGSSLRKFLTENGRMPAEVAAAMAIEIADALEHAHQNGVIHRDIKPENVLIADSGRGSLGPTLQESKSRGGRVKLTDFGIAKILDAQGVTVTGQVLGSPSHMAPEQIEGNEVTARADVFGLGVLIYESMTGRLPFEGQNPAQVLRKVIEGRFVPAERLLPTIGAELGRIVDRALSHDLSGRYESAAQFAGALRAELSRLGFDEPYAELLAYLDAARTYASEYPDRIVPRLLTAARRAREERQVLLSASLINRALAYRPHDSELIAAVARITKQRARLRRSRRLALWATTALVLVAMVVLTGRFLKVRFSPHSLPPRPVQVVANPDSPEVAPAAKPSVASATDVEVRSDESRKRAAPDKNSGRRSPERSAVSRPAPTRSVQVVITGASGGRLLIDGEEVPWLGVHHELEVGTHQFEVVPPSESCCMPTSPKQISIVPGLEDQRVILSVEFREAALFAQAPIGGTVICGELFRGPLSIPGKKTIRVIRAETRAKCTILPPQGSTALPKTVDVVLRPGDTFTVSN